MSNFCMRLLRGGGSTTEADRTLTERVFRGIRRSSDALVVAKACGMIEDFCRRKVGLANDSLTTFATQSRKRYQVLVHSFVRN